MKISNKTLGKVILILLSSLFIIVVLAAIIITVYVSTSKTGARHAGETKYEITTDENGYINENTGEYEKEDEKIPQKTFFALYGVDKGKKLSDVIIVACLDIRKNTLNALSIPRDTFVKLPNDRLQTLSKNGLWAPSNGMKITELHSYAGEFGNEFLTLQLEEMLDIPIDYYFEIDLDAFTKIVDAVGGVEIDVPRNMYYSDPTQGLRINIKKGLQTLDGETAQGFVRYRQYRLGDLERIEMQQMFLKSLMNKVLDKSTFILNAPSFLKIFIENVTTNMTISDGLNYIKPISSITQDSVTMETLPGDGNTPYHYDKKEAKKTANRLFYDIKELSESEKTSEETTKTINNK